MLESVGESVADRGEIVQEALWFGMQRQVLPVLKAVQSSVRRELGEERFHLILSCSLLGDQFEGLRCGCIGSQARDKDLGDVLPGDHPIVGVPAQCVSPWRNTKRCSSGAL